MNAEVMQSAADGAASPSISDDEQYQKLDSASLWQQGQGSPAGDGVPAGIVPAPDAEPEVQRADMDDREVGCIPCCVNLLYIVMHPFEHPDLI